MARGYGGEALAGPCPYPARIIIGGEPATVRCGKCIRCRSMRQSMYIGRMVAEASLHPQSLVATLTFNDKSYDALGVSSWIKPDIIKANKALFQRVRYHWPDWSGKYFVVWEQGEAFGRTHAHVILFGTPYAVARKQTLQVPWWQHGFAQFDKVTPAAARYVSAYCSDPDKEKLRLHSRGSDHLGIPRVKQYLDTVAGSLPWPGAKIKWAAPGFLPGPFFELDQKKYPLPLPMYRYAQSLGLDAEWESKGYSGHPMGIRWEGDDFRKAERRLREYQAMTPPKNKLLQNGVEHTVKGRSHDR